MQKRGASVIIGWVLLVGLSVVLAIMVTTWMKQQTQQSTDYIVSDTENDLRCQEVSLKAFVEVAPCQILNISNSGYHTIKKVSVRHKFGFTDEEVNLVPQQDSKHLNILLPVGIDTVEIIPIIESQSELIGCAQRKLVIEC